MKVLGMETDELSLMDINEEISDLIGDLNCIAFYKCGYYTYSQLKQETTFEPEDENKILEALAILREEKAKKLAEL